MDGPAGSGKSSVLSSFGQKTRGGTYINTGALYRALGFVCSPKWDANWENDSVLVEQVQMIVAELRWEAASAKLFFKDRDMTPDLDSEAASSAASRAARHPLVRGELIDLQRRLGLSAPTLAIVDGRDIGTVHLSRC